MLLSNSKNGMNALFCSLGLALGSFALVVEVPTADLATGLVERQTPNVTQTCSSQVHLMIAGGCSLPCASDELGLLDTLIGNLTSEFPLSTQYIVPYDGAEYQAQISTTWMIAAANAYAEQCPTTPIVFVGYSLGGIVVMNTLCGGMNVSYAPNVLAAITYGEETYRYPEPYDVGSCTQNAPLYPRNNTDQCAPFADAIHSYCDTEDPECCKGGQYPLAHFEYPSEYDILAAKWVLSRWNALTTSTTTTTTGTATPPPQSSTVISTGTTTVTTETATTDTTTLTRTTVSTAVSTSTATSTLSTTSVISVTSTTVISYSNTTVTRTTTYTTDTTLTTELETTQKVTLTPSVTEVLTTVITATTTTALTETKPITQTTTTEVLKTVTLSSLVTPSVTTLPDSSVALVAPGTSIFVSSLIPISNVVVPSSATTYATPPKETVTTIVPPTSAYEPSSTAPSSKAKGPKSSAYSLLASSQDVSTAPPLSTAPPSSTAPAPTTTTTTAKSHATGSTPSVSTGTVPGPFTGGASRIGVPGASLIAGVLRLGAGLQRALIANV